MNSTCLNLMPESYLDVKVSLDKNLLEIGKEIFSFFVSEGKFASTHFDNDTDECFRKAAWIDFSNESMQLIDRQQWELLNKIEKYLDTTVTNVKVERLNTVSNADKILNNISRFSNISTNGYTDNCSVLGTRAWHTDHKDDLNAINFIVYLNDIDYGMGGVHIVEPVQSPVTGQSTGTFTFSEEIKSEDVPFKEYIGQAGTVVAFNGHVIHRANIPRHSYREVLHFVIHSNLKKHYAEPYL